MHNGALGEVCIEFHGSRSSSMVPPMLAASIQAPRRRDLSKMHLHNFVLAGDVVLALGDEPLSLG
jgi:hypothetical protein